MLTNYGNIGASYTLCNVLVLYIYGFTGLPIGTSKIYRLYYNKPQVLSLAFLSQLDQVALYIIKPLLNLIRVYLVNYSYGFTRNLASYSLVSLVSIKVQSAKKRVLSIQSLIILRPFNRVYRRQGLQVNYSILSLLI